MSTARDMIEHAHAAGPEMVDLPRISHRSGRVDALVPKYLLDAARAVLADRERELLELKGPCSNSACRLHYAHSGPCDCRTEEDR